jgi:hypothetical protein
MRLTVLCLAMALCWPQHGFAQDLMGTWQSGGVGLRINGLDEICPLA